MAKPRKKSAKASKPAKKAAKKTSGKLNKTEGEHRHTNLPRTGEIGVLPPATPAVAGVPQAGTPAADPNSAGGPPVGAPANGQ